MSRTSGLKEQMQDLAALSARLSDNPALQIKLDRRVQGLSRSIAQIEEMEFRETAKAIRVQQLADKLTELGRRIDDISADVTKDADEKRTFKERLVAHLGAMSDSDEQDAVLAQYDYLKDKGFTKKQIRLVLDL